MTHELDASGEPFRLRRCVHDLMRMMALPVRWRGQGAKAIGTSLLEGLVTVLDLEFANLRLTARIEDLPADTLCLNANADPSLTHLLRPALERWLAAPTRLSASRVVPNPMGSGHLSIAFHPLGLQEDRGVLVVGARRQTFPDEGETLVLRVAVNQALLGLEETRRLAEQRSGSQRSKPRSVGSRAPLGGEAADPAFEGLAHERSERERLQLAALVEHSSDFIGLSSPEGQVWFVNAAGQQLIGLDSDEQARGTQIADYVAPRDHWRLEHQVMPAVQRTGRWEGELSFRNFLTGNEVPMLAHVFAIRALGKDTPIGLATISRAITQRKQEEGELLALKDELAAELMAMTRLHEFSTRLLTRTDLSSLSMEVLVATMALQNADLGNVQIRSPASGALEIVAQIGFRQDFLEAFVAGVDESATCCRSIKSGSRVIVEDVMSDASFTPNRAVAAEAGFRAVQSTPLFDSHGEPLGVISTHFRQPHRPSERDLRFTDMYARLAVLAIEWQRAQSALKRSEFHLTEAQRVGNIGSWVFNSATGEVFWSAEFYRVLGFPPAVRPTRERFWEAVHPDDLAFVRARFERAVAAGDGFDEQFRIVHGNGCVRHVHGFGMPAPADAERRVEYVGTLVDITERKLAEEATRRARNDLARVGRAVTLGEFSASIAHELNQPLAAMATNASACVRWLAAAPANVVEADACARRIISDARRAGSVIERVRSLLTRSEPKPSELSAGDIVTEVVSLIQGEARARGVTVSVAIDANLPTFWGDRIQLQQVLLNLSVNAIEAMRGVSDRPRELGIHVGQDGSEHVLFEVRDTGPGLEPEHRERVFDAFYTTKEHGMGMGLAICRSIVGAHGGRLWATPNPGSGEVFTFSVPTRQT